MRRIPKIDAIRFLAAAAVVLHHAPPPPILGAWTWIYRDVIFGPSAVVVFFVVSGLCIHGPMQRVAQIDWSSYFVRRYTRILIPVLCVLPLGIMFGVSYHPYGGWVTWSLICELIYYSLYPLMLPAARRYGWAPLIAVAFVIGYVAVAATGAGDGNSWLRFRSDVLSNLPAWLLGCWLAERLSNRRAPSFRFVKATGMIGISILIAVIHYAGLVSLIWTLPAFSLQVVVWLDAELRCSDGETVLSRAGSWSYSLYLVHPLAIYGIAPLLFTAHNNIGWAAMVLSAFVWSFAFYLAVERPSHDFAQRAWKQRAARSRA
ncbi:acyltransferase [Rubrivivax sp. JA1024]|nr:acyltransferase [Rubrivivax sp. JA1024]